MKIPDPLSISIELMYSLEKIGLDRTIGSLTMKEIKDISLHIQDFICKAQIDDEPPF